MKVKDILNLISLIMSSYIGLSYIYGYGDINNIVNGLFLYTIIDCYNSRIDMIIHHIIVIIMISISKIKQISDEDLLFLCFHLFKVEISTIFLQGASICGKINLKMKSKIISKLESLIQLMFIITFIYYRIIDYPMIAIYNSKFNKILLNYHIQTESSIIAVSFYFLNLYWLSLIIKKILIKIYV